MIIHRQTVRSEVVFEGVTLHGGEPVRMTLHPSEEGIVFRYGGGSWRATPDQVSDTTRCTKLGDVATIEHLMSAFAGLEITDCVVDLSAPELPAAGGAAIEYVNGILAVGLEPLPDREVKDIFSRVFVQDGLSKIAIAAGSGHWAYRYDVGERWPGHQEFEMAHLPTGYAETIAPARTFGLSEELPHLERLGLARGLDASSALVLGAEGYENEARFPDEPARHKLLDVIGDLYLSGIPIRFLDVVSERAGHKMNVQAAHKLALTMTGTAI